MSTKPRFDIVDKADLTALRDLSPAEASALTRLPHALMTGWGGPASSRTFVRYADTTTVTSTISYRTPPNVTDIDIACLMFGDGTVKFTTAVDPLGTLLRSNGQGVGTAGFEVVEAAVWHKTNGVLNTDGFAVLAATTQRALSVYGAELWEWQDIDITVELNPDATSKLYTFALAFYPLHVTR